MWTSANHTSSRRQTRFSLSPLPWPSATRGRALPYRGERENTAGGKHACLRARRQARTIDNEIGKAARLHRGRPGAGCRRRCSMPCPMVLGIRRWSVPHRVQGRIRPCRVPSLTGPIEARLRARAESRGGDNGGHRYRGHKRRPGATKLCEELPPQPLWGTRLAPKRQTNSGRPPGGGPGASAARSLCPAPCTLPLVVGSQAARALSRQRTADACDTRESFTCSKAPSGEGRSGRPPAQMPATAWHEDAQKNAPRQGRSCHITYRKFPSLAACVGHLKLTGGVRCIGT